MVVQYGRGTTRPPTMRVKEMEIELFSLKPSLFECISSSDLVIGHGGGEIVCFYNLLGAGTVLETLEANKKFIVVINDALMGNHQTELAERMAQERFLIATSVRYEYVIPTHSHACRNLHSELQQLQHAHFEMYKRGDPKLFGTFLETI